jgi:AcrR family transcriptional regulator
MGRPLTRMLSQDMIIEAALTLIDKGQPFTIPALGKHLGVNPSSLYHYVRGRQEILELVRERLIESVGRSPDMSGAGWQDVVWAWAQGYRTSFAEHPHLVRLLTAQTVSSPRVLQSYEDLAAVLLRAGFSPVQVQMVITVLDNFFLGSALDLAAPNEVWRTEVLPGSALALAVDESPTGKERADAAFEFGLTALLRGLESLRGQA